MLRILTNLRWSDALDVLVVTVLIWTALAWLRRMRSRLAILGVLFLAAVYLVARQLELRLTVLILQGLSAVVVIALVVIFQDDLRRFFEQIAVWGLRRRASPLPADTVEVLVETARRQQLDATGALYVIAGRQSLEPHLEGGREIDARLSMPLLLSLFDSRTPGHDGAVIVEGDRMSRFGVHLPLSTNHAAVGVGGTRHAAALGLCELTDAMCVVVSEERRTLSVARDGQLRTLGSVDELAGEIRSFLDHTTHAGSVRRGRRLAVGRWYEGLAALALALLAWAALVPGSTLVEAERMARVEVHGLPGGYDLARIEPPEILVVLQGSPLFLPAESDVLIITLEPDPDLLELDRRTFRLHSTQVQVSPRLRVVELRPDRVVLSFAENGSG